MCRKVEMAATWGVGGTVTNWAGAPPATPVLLCPLPLKAAEGQGKGGLRLSLTSAALLESGAVAASGTLCKPRGSAAGARAGTLLQQHSLALSCFLQLCIIQLLMRNTARICA